MPTTLSIAKEEIGSIFEIKTSQVYHYIQYVNLYIDHGIPILGILDQVRQVKARSLVDILDVPYKYFVLYGGKRKGLRRVGVRLLSIEQSEFPKFRAPGLWLPNDKPIHWFIYNVPLTFNYHRLLDPSVRDRVESLTKSQKDLSIASIIGYPSLLEKLETGWLPKDET
jgi:hypothetical protein